jgi:hypothetical protein
MLHACNAVDGTAGKLSPRARNNARFTDLLRRNYSILGPMGAPGIDVEKTRFPVAVKRPRAPGGKPDLADVIYGIHRCCHGHGDELPAGFDLIADAVGPAGLTHMKIEKGKIQLSDRVIFGLLACAILSPINSDQTVPDSYFLTYGESDPLYINEWWGRAGDFDAVIATVKLPQVEMKFGNWMDE